MDNKKMDEYDDIEELVEEIGGVVSKYRKGLLSDDHATRRIVYDLIFNKYNDVKDNPEKKERTKSLRKILEEMANKNPELAY